MGAWEDAAALAKKHQGTGKYLRLQNDGDKEVLAFLGEPLAREVIWNEKDETYDPAPPGAEKASLRVSINVYSVTAKKVQIFEMSIMVFQTMLAVKEKYGLANWYFEVKRSGAAKSPKTTYSILPEKNIPDADKADLAKLELFDLKKDAEEGSSDKAATAGSNGATPAGGVTLDQEVGNQIVAKLKELPNSATAVAEFLATFNVKKIRDVPKSRQDEALALVEKLCGASKPAAAPAEVDPFG